MAWLSVLAPKIIYTALLLWLILIFIGEIKKVWSDRQRELGAFTYSEGGKLNASKSTDFTLRIQQQQRFMIATLTGKRKTSDNPVYAEDFKTSELDIQPIELKKSDLETLEMKIQGFDISKVLSYLRTWVTGRNEVSGRLDSLDGQYQLFAEWRAYDPDAGRKTPIFYTLSHPSEAKAACDLAGRLVYTNIREALAGKQKPVLDRIRYWISRLLGRAVDDTPQNELTRTLIKEFTDAEFARFLCAWEVYQKPSSDRKDLDAEIAVLGKLLSKKDRTYPPIHYLQSLLILRAEPLEDVAAGEKHPKHGELVSLLERYIEFAAAFGFKGTAAKDQLAKLRGRETATLVARAAGLPSVRPGSSLGSASSPGFSACCVVEKDDTKYLVTVDYGFVRAPVGSDAISPGGIDGGTPEDKIGIYVDLLQQPLGGGVAFIELSPGLDAKNLLPDHTEFTELADVPPKGSEVVLFGRTSKESKGTVKDLDLEIELNFGNGPVPIKGLFAATKMSQGGDGGGAVLDAQGRLVGLQYAGTNTADDSGESYFLPLKPLLEEHGFKLSSSP